MCGKRSFLETVGNVVTNVTTGGLVGVDAEGSLSGGVTGTPITKGLENVAKGAEGFLKEVTGANAAEEANKLDREMFEQSKLDAIKQREAATAMKAQNDMASSKLAAGSESNSNSSSSSKNSFFSRYGLGNQGIQKDFLGL